jgi:hypothetical protein
MANRYVQELQQMTYAMFNVVGIVLGVWGTLLVILWQRKQ